MLDSDKFAQYRKTWTREDYDIFLQMTFDEYVVYLYNQGRWDILDASRAKAKQIYRAAYKRLADQGADITRIIRAKEWMQNQ